ncbi:OstA-like protein [Mucilaginibacter gracilis]|uniref:OstA-like protein n=1 Tax=Mucilaginibacter gracilis TaxID=423350 RepID=A0A495J926_9SPHI|nr:OstA-like protein [Mucilaginibacter gracilis]
MIVILLLIGGQVLGQKRGSLLRVIKSDSTRGYTKDGVTLTIVYRAVFQQDNTILSSDSAYLHQKENAFDAFGHVIITQGDTLHIFGDKLNYQGNTKIAIMTDNVRLIDKDAVLTTNYFTYNTGTKFGTYTGGGKLVSKDNTLTSQNGYYFASSRDAYFRYNVVLNTVDAIIKTDTLRYNSGSRIAYFYGPTNIYGKKDKDTLYTENGTYNTQTEQAFFGKKNLYKQNTKSLKGDSLFYDRLAGYGKAVKHVTFKDSEQKIILHGDLGETFKKGDRTLVTQHAYVVFVTEEKDTSKTSKPGVLKKDSVTTQQKTAVVKKPALNPPKNSMPVVDSAQVKQARDMAVKAAASLTPSQKDTLVATAKKAIAKGQVVTAPPNTMPVIDNAQVNALKNLANAQLNGVPKSKRDSVINRVKAAANNKAALTSAKKSLPSLDEAIKAGNALANKNMPVVKDTLPKKDTTRIKRDSIFMTADSIETRITTYKELKTIKEERRIAGLRDTSIKIIPSIVYTNTKPVKYLDIAIARMRPDTTVFHRGYFKKKPTVVDTSQHKAAIVVPQKVAKPIVQKFIPVDSVNISQEVKLSDTARVRILTAAHHAKIFKSDLQARADSIFFSYSDSVARMYIHPMIWVQGSQLSADTINLQMKKKQLDNIELYPSAFIVNIEEGDSTHFNQVGGKKMRGFFKNGKMDKMFVFANAETIYFMRDSGKVTQMRHSITSKIRVRFKNNEPLDVMEYIKPDATITPITQVKDDKKILRGFIWKPEDRPVSKEAIINPVIKKPVKKGPAKPDGKNLPTKPDGKGEIKPGLHMAKDSINLKTDTLPHIKAKTDTLPRIKAKTDTAKLKPHEQTKQ